MLRSSRHRRQPGTPLRLSGFTLFEVVLAITILSVAVTGVLSAFNGMNEAHRLMERRTEASLYSRNIVARIRNQILNPKSQETEGEFEGTDYRYKVKFSQTDWDKLYSVSIDIEWGDEQTPEKINVYTLQYYE